MTAARSLTFKVATDAAEFEQIFALNHRTFVEEIPQHAPDPRGRLVDRFHAENTYLIAMRGEQLVGMLAVRGQRPFSLDEKLGPIDRFLPAGCTPCEVRLLAVRPEHRGGLVLRGLLQLLREVARERGYDLAALSGTVRQLALYRHLGCVPFGPLVGTPAASYQPMLLTLGAFERHAGPVLARAERPATPPLSFLPGPVAIAADVQRAFALPPISHRDPAYHARRRAVERSLCRLTGARHAAILLGSGTLGNDVVAGQLAGLGGHGVVLTNGEFGARLADHAHRAGLAFTRVSGDGERPFGRTEIERALDGPPAARWLWTPLCETSTGVLEDLPLLRELCKARGVHLCLDAVSAIGAVPVDLRDVWFATAVSGKALGAHPGLAIVLHSHTVAPQPDRLPRYLDLGLHHASGGVPFTQSSNLLAALAAALTRFGDATPFTTVRTLAGVLRERLRALGLPIVVPDACANPAVTTLALRGDAARTLGDALAARGFLVSYQSDYLRARGRLQICLMGDHDRARLERLLQALPAVLGAAEPVRTAAVGAPANG